MKNIEKSLSEALQLSENSANCSCLAQECTRFVSERSAGIWKR